MLCVLLKWGSDDVYPRRNYLTLRWRFNRCLSSHDGGAGMNYEIVPEIEIAAFGYFPKSIIGKAQYGNGRLCLVLLDAETGERNGVATVNIPEVDLPEDHICLKGWSENVGLPEALEKAGVVKLTGSAAENSFVQAPIAKVLI